MMISPGQVLAGQYFTRRRSLALALSECGVSVGNILVPPLVTYLLGQYALEGTLLIYGAVCLNSLPAAMLHRPTSFFSRRRLLRRRGGRDDAEAAAAASAAAPAAVVVVVVVSSADPIVPLRVDDERDSSTVRLCREIVVTENGDGGCCLPSPAAAPQEGGGGGGGVIRSPMLENQNRLGPSSSDVSGSLSRNGELGYPSSSSTKTDGGAATAGQRSPLDAKWEESRRGNPKPASQSGEPGSGERRTTATTVLCSFRRILQCVLWCPKELVLSLDFSLFRKPLFCLFMLFVAVSHFVSVPVDYLPALVSQHGVTESQAAELLSIIGGLDLVCRLTCGLLVSLNRVRVTNLAAFSYVILAVLMQCVRLMTTYEHFVALAVIQGLLGGVPNCLFPVLVLEFVGLEDMAKCIGFNQLVAGAAMAGIYPLLGQSLSLCLFIVIIMIAIMNIIILI